MFVRKLKNHRFDERSETSNMIENTKIIVATKHRDEKIGIPIIILRLHEKKRPTQVGLVLRLSD